MGTAASRSSEEEEEEGAEEGMEAAGAAPQPGPASPAPPLPPAEALLEQARLREAAGRLREAALPEPLVSRHHSALVRWLEERLSRGEEAVSLEQFCEVLESVSRLASGARGESEEAFAQFDAEGDGTVDVENMLEALKNCSGANLQGELSHVIRQLQACSLVPGFIDIFSESKERLSLHASMILKFLHRNRISSTAVPYPVLEYFNNICTMRSSVLKDSLDRLLLKEREYPTDLNGNQELDKLKSVTKCYTHIETSSNSADIDKMTNGETTSFWQSDGSARSHWIRLKMKPDVILRHLSIAVAASDQSYMPQQVTVAVGRSASSLQEVRDVHIPSNITGYVTLLENANISQMCESIKIPSAYFLLLLKAKGWVDGGTIFKCLIYFRRVSSHSLSGFLMLFSLFFFSRKALQHMPPLSLTPGSTDFSSFLSPNVLEEVDSFLIRITSCCTTPEVELTLLAFALARGSVAKVISSLCTITDHLDTPYEASSLIASMATVRQNLLYKYGKPLRLTLQACDVKGKEDKSGPENLLVEPWTGDGFLTETGKTRASIILSTGTESSFQVTQIRIKVCGSSVVVFKYLFFFIHRSSCPLDDLGDDDPVGWFEVEEEWDEVDVKIQRCRIAQYLMIKFLCTRQDTAERLGVQGLSVLGYLRPMRDEPNRSMSCLQCRNNDDDTVCGTTLLLKTLHFIQQLAQDLVQQKESGLKYKSFLDFTGLDLQVFWNFYNKLHQNPREECIYAQTLLLQLLQSCFSVLAGDSKTAKPQEISQSKTSGHAEAAEELYRHLCEAVVDMGDSNFTPLKMLKEEVQNTLLSGAAIFFPDRQTRRQQLFTMMKNITEQEHKQSVRLAFKSLCTYFSDQDPGGLLLLPEKGVSANFDINEVLSVMETLLLVAARECEMMMLDVAQPESGTVLSSLFWSVQGSLLSWCYLQLKGGDSAAKDLAVEILKNYVGQFLSNIRTILQSLLSQYSGKTIVEKISNSVFAMATRQLVIFLLDFCTLDIPHCTLLQGFSTLIEPLKSLCTEPHKMEMESWQQEQPVVLRTWTMESPHNYENNCHEVSVFLCHGATYFEVEFDDKCETERRYDYLEFTDARGAKTRYDTKVGTEKWPKKVTFKAGPRLQFLFHSDSSNNEWGYKFSVTAYGLPDVAVSWGLDLQLLVSRLMGRLASRSMALKSLRELSSEADSPPLKVTSVLNSPLWKPVFRHQMCPEALPGASRGSQLHRDDKESSGMRFNKAKWPVLHLGHNNPEQLQTRRSLAGNCLEEKDLGVLVTATEHEPAVAQVAKKANGILAWIRHVNSGGKVPLSDEFAQVYALADSIRIWMLEMKQKALMGRGNDAEEKQSTEVSEVNPETLAKLCTQKSLLLLNFLPVRAKVKDSASDSSEAQDLGDVQQHVSEKSQRKCSVVDTDFQASNGVTHPVSKDGAQITQPDTKIKQVPEPLQTEASTIHSKTAENTASQQEEVASPPSTPTRKSQFSRGRLRLLSFRSMEEPRPVPTVKEKYPILKNALDFIKDQSLSHESVLKVLALRKSQGQVIVEVLKTIRQCLDSLGQPHCFHPPCVLFLLELLACQKDFTNYFGNLEGCGAELHKEIRESYYQLVLFLVNSVKGFGAISDRSLLPALSCVQTALLHLLDMSWEPSDLSFFVEIQLPNLLMTTSQENISIHDSVICQWSEEDEIADYKQNCEWMDECQDVMFETWYEKIAQADPEKQRKMHMFVARYCDLLNVDISCDGCDEIAPWHRYRCLQCNDMDLCKTCFLGGVKPEGHEDDHEMVNIEYACDHCQGVIIGRRMNCNVCDDFDLCYGCYSAKKYSESHLPTHSITVYPMVTIRTSDRQRLIQPYVHNYSWLLFAALTLYSADLANGEEVEGEKLDPQVLGHARALQQQCIQLIGDCLMKAQHGKGLKNLALLGMLPEGESFSENNSVSVSPPPDRAPRSHPRDNAVKGKQGKASAGPFTHCNVSTYKVGKEGRESKAVVTNKAVLRQESGLSVDENVSPAGRFFLVFPVTEISIRMRSKQLHFKQAEKVLIPSQEQVFAECSQKRILGLLAAMLPPFKSGSTMSLLNLEQILPLMFQVVISNAGHLNETYHLTLGLLGQLILRLKPAEVDAAVTKVLSAKHNL
ncbi:ZZEF1 protein, partial [Piaya cayana]|nr:ZZEF1 protein [Piaya cayana]